jgi:hypothetical protein
MIRFHFVWRVFTLPIHSPRFWWTQTCLRFSSNRPATEAAGQCVYGKSPNSQPISAKSAPSGSHHRNRFNQFPPYAIPKKRGFAGDELKLCQSLSEAPG